MNWYLKVFHQYFDFKGRARRKEFWMFSLIHIIVLILLVFVDSFLGTTIGSGDNAVGILYLVYILAVLIPGLAVTVRRLHDIGKSGWMYFVALIPFIGGIWLLVLLCMEGENKTNQWGENPKGIGNNREIDAIGKE